MAEHTSTRSRESGGGVAVRLRIDEERPRRASVVLILSGDADLRGAGELRDRLAEAASDGAAHVVVDLSSVTFIDSMALGVLLAAHNRLRQLGGELRLVVASPELQRIFELSLLNRVFAVDSTRAEALSRLAGRRPTA